MRHWCVISVALLSALFASSALASAPVVMTDRSAVSMTNTAATQFVQRQISAREARAIALARVPGGEVVDIRRTSNSYRVRIIARDGRVVDIVVDANTGRVR